MAKQHRKPAAKDEQLAELLVKVKKLEKYRKAARTNYAAADRVSEELIAVLKVRKSIDLGDGRTARLVDNFADKNKAFKNQFFARFEVAIG